jgi:hypothetical protein
MAGARPRILLQTSIPYSADDWHVGRFSLLAAELERWAEVVPRNREAAEGGDDPVLVGLDTGTEFDEVWLFAVDSGQALSKRECAALNAFQRRGGGILTARDHANMGMWLRDVEGIGEANFFHEPWCWETDPERRAADDTDTPNIPFPNYHSGANGDVHEISPTAPPHPLLADPDSPDGQLRRFPSHPHEGAVCVPAGSGRARAVAGGKSTITGRPFDLVVAFERADGVAGRAVAHSSFHHFVDCNWSPKLGAPSFVTERFSDRIERNPRLLDDIRRYVRNCVDWLRPGAA